MRYLTELIAIDHEGAIRGIHSLTIALANSVIGQRIEEIDCQGIYNKEAKYQQYFLNIGVVDNSGNVICSGIEYDGAVSALNDVDFQEFLQKKEFVVSGYRISKITKGPSIRFIEPIFDNNGSIKGAFFVTVDPSWLNGLPSNFELPSEFVISKFDQFGNVFVRYPEPQKWTGTDQSESELFNKIKLYGRGSAEIRGLNGVLRYYYFRPVYLDGNIVGYVAIGL